MLKQRIITALLLLLVLLPATFAQRYEYFAALALVGMMLAMWEWARLLRLSFAASVTVAAVLGIVCAYLWMQGFAAAYIHGLLIASLLCWALAIAVSLSQAQIPAFFLTGFGRMLHLAFAGLALAATWVVLVLAQQRGAWFVLTLLLIVWVADIAAYFAGKRFGKHKLAPCISPGKTREGAIGGLLAAALLGLCLYTTSGTYQQALSANQWFYAALGMLALAAVSIMGDLFESLLKRQAGAKDSSKLLPGHGGVLDRIDALLPTLPLAWLLLSLV